MTKREHSVMIRGPKYKGKTTKQVWPKHHQCQARETNNGYLGYYLEKLKYFVIETRECRLGFVSSILAEGKHGVSQNRQGSEQ